MTNTPARERITEAMLDKMLEDEDLAGLFHSGELFAELRRKLAERILDTEMEVHLSQPEERVAGNSRNGHNPKTVLTDTGSMPLEVPRDRKGTFEPQLVEKYCRRLPGFDDKVIHLFSRGMSTRRIRETVRELYGVEVSPDLISRVTDVVMEEYAEWQSRPLRDTYAIVYLDAIHVKVRDAGSVSTRRALAGPATYLAIGVDEGGHKDVLGLWLGEHEGAKFWLNVLNELKSRGLRDILIAVVDGLKGFPEALETAFPETTVQTCIVHLMRHSLSCASYKERRKLADALKPIYKAESAERAEELLDAFEESELGRRHPDVVRSWRDRWHLVIPFLAFSQLIRKAIYTTNAIESLNATVRRAVRARGHFTSVGAAKKLIYLALREASSKWRGPMLNWQSAKREFAIHFGDRFNPSKGWVTKA